MQPKKWMVDAYNAGAGVKDQDLTAAIYAGKVPDWIFLSHAPGVFFEAGRLGHDFPAWVTGWRYGNIPECGQSYNYRDNRPEDGVSVMEIDGGEQTQDKISAFFVANGRPVVKVAGYLNPYRRGADGEPLLVCAVTL